MIPLTTWFYLAAASAIICFFIALVDDRPWTVDWIGSSYFNVVVRHAVAMGILIGMMAIKATCAIGCGNWFASTILLLYALAVVGWPLQSLLYSAMTFSVLVIWGGVLGFSWGIVGGSVQFLLFLLCVFVAFLHLRERVLYIALIPIPSVLIELSDMTKHAWRTIWPPMQTLSSAQAGPTLHRVHSQSTATTQVPGSRSTTERTPPPPQPDAVPQNSSPLLGSVQSAFFAAIELYLFTLVIEGGAALVRSIFFFCVSLVALSPLYIFMFINSRWRYHQEVETLFGTTWTYDYGRWLTDNLGISLAISLLVGLAIGCWPLVRSLFHAFFPYTRSGAGESERDALGAREPTRAEHQKIIDVLETIQETAARVIAAPSSWLVIDAPTPDAYTIGSTVYVTSAAIEDKHFAGIVAHELGHLAHKDGDLILSLRRFVIPLAYFVGVDRQPTPAGTVLARGTGMSVDVIRNEDEKIFYRFKALQIKLLLAFWTGGLGLFFLGRQWARFWRERDLLADEYAVQLGQADSLMGILRTYRHSDVAQPFLLSSRPYTAERLDRLQG